MYIYALFILKVSRAVLRAMVGNMIRDRVPLECILLVDLLASERSILSDDSKELNKASFQNAAPFPGIQIKHARSSHFPA